MSDRPTPEQIGDDLFEDPNTRILLALYLKSLRHFGYVIVHPDDHPNRDAIDRHPITPRNRR